MSYTSIAPHRSGRTTTGRARQPERGTARTSVRPPRTARPVRVVRLRDDSGVSDRPLDTYSEQIHPYSLLSAAEERSLGEASLRGDQQARERLALANLRLVVAIARDFLGRGLPMEDLVGEGNLGLLRAVQDYDPGFGVRFSTYASYWIKESIQRALKTTTAPIRLPVYLVNLLTKWHRVERELSQQTGSPPSHDEIAARLGLSLAQKQNVEQALRAHRCHVGSPSEENTSFAEAVAEVEQPEARLDLLECQQTLRHGLSLLDPMERDVLTLHLGLDEGPPKPLNEISETLGLTRDRVRKLEATALRKLKRAWQNSMECQPALGGSARG
ncbi:sigma-70 family RNA polymerase sigma factor [Tautonia marina]|uniref:sigma-70 family RNA polymerase sigma factor n=1 Tax=Tautonia marina TaxID=2653855 RepID=UPI001261318F|nr:RNA polymerase sigma factor RpoD/SigA [Tautonia marina]